MDQPYANHNGGGLAFGPDGYLYVSTGETGNGALAQDPDSLGGKFLRVAVQDVRGGGGEPQIFSRGHRNSQGFDWHPRTGRLVATEHGPSGGDGPRGFDEVNVVREGGNYGWPEVYGSDHGSFDRPAIVYEEAIAPAGGSFVTLPGSAWTGDFVFGALVGEQVRRVRLRGNRAAVDERVEEVVAGKRIIADLALPASSSLADLGPDQLRAALGLRPDQVIAESATGDAVNAGAEETAA